MGSTLDSTNGIILYSEYGKFEKELTFNDMVNITERFWRENDPTWKKHNLKIMKENLIFAISEIDKLIDET